MDFFEVVRSRRSCREFSDDPVPSKDIETCLEAARLAPSATNSHPWRFLVAKKADFRAALAEAGFNQPLLKQAPVITVLLGDRGIYKKPLRRANELADVGALSTETLATLEVKYKEKPESSREMNDAAIRVNCMIAGEHYVLAATALGLGTCWVGLFDSEKVMEILRLDPKYNFPIAFLPTGRPARELPPPRPRYSLSDVAWRDEMGRPWVAGS
ncbi:MAG: nitroreductase family protein [Planctomycetes bacterium]|nr:nitroreductase family protein [Planctomycetota bacterium]